MDYLRIGRATEIENSRERAIYRMFEILPGALSWLTLIGAIILSWQAPFFIAYFIIAFGVLWLAKTIYFAFHLKAGFDRMREHEKIDWLQRLKNLSPLTSHLSPQTWRDIYHLILLPNRHEPLEVIRESLQSFIDCDYPKDRMIVVVSFEEREGSQRKVVAQKIKQEFEGKFFRLVTTFHPDDIEGELIAHGSNDTWAAKQAQKLVINPLAIPYENIIVSSFDVDTRAFPKYFSCLTWHYLTSQSPCRTSFQPIPLYINNIWQAAVISRVFSFSATFWQIMCQERPEKLLTFSSHAMSFRALADVGFKQTNVVSDDSRIFWQCFFAYNGDYRVKPIFYPVSMDACVTHSFLRTIINLYKQQQRWAYGVGDVAYFLFGFLKNKKIPLREKISRGFELIEGHWSWATAPVLLSVLGWMPIILGGAGFSSSLVAYSLPKLASKIMTIAMIGLIGSIYFSILLLPPKPPEYGKFKYLVFIFGWLLVPITMIFFSALPALDAQTRWMLGKYMGFWCTPKIRKS